MNLDAFGAFIEEQKLNVEGITVLHRGKEIARRRWVPETPRNVFSVAKSFTSIAVGMAIDEEKLALNDRVLDFFPGQAPAGEDPRLASLELEHLLTMTRGHGEFSRPRSVAEALSQDLAHDPGTVFVYDNGSTLLASAMVSRAVGKTVLALLTERLFRPLGIPDPVWAESDDGHTIGGTGLSLSTGSLALFGQFLLQRGNWQGKQLVSSAWIDGATRTQVSTKDSRHPDYDLGYGYQFWTCRHGAYRCDGRDGQFVVVLPREEAVAAINSDEEDMHPILYAVWDYILPQLR